MARPRKGGLFKNANGVWVFRIQINGKRYTKTTGTKSWPAACAKRREFAEMLGRTDSQELLSSIKIDLERHARETRGDWRLGRIRIEEAWEKVPYVKTARQRERTLAEGTITDNKSQWTQFLKFRAATFPLVEYLDEVTREHVRMFRTDLVARVTGSRVNKIMDTCRIMFNNAGIDSGPFEAWPRCGHVSRHREPLSEAELKKIIGTATGELRLLLVQGMYSGGRLKAIVTRKWRDHVDPELKFIRGVEPKMQHMDKEIRYAVHPLLRQVLGETPIEEREGYVTPGLARKYDKSRSRVSQIVTEHIRRNVVNGASRAIGFHSLRHSVATMLAENGVPQAVAEALLGHNNTYVHRIYIHVGNKAVDDAICGLPWVLDAQKGQEETGDAAATAIQALEKLSPEDREKVLATWQSGNQQG